MNYNEKNPPKRIYGDKGSRTPGLYIANVSLYQLSYIPEAELSIAFLF